jgi:type II secretory pathway pseudopilin PulG
VSGEAPLFLFEGQTYSDPAGLAEAFVHHWEEAKKRLYRGQVRRWAEAFDLDLANRCQDLEEGETDQDRGVFRMIYHLHPGAAFAYRGEVHASPEAVGAALGRALGAGDRTSAGHIAEALAKGLLSQWLRRRGRDELAAAVDDLTGGLAEDREFTLFRLHFLLCPERPYLIAGSELATPLDVALFLARDWAGRAGLAWDTALLAWLTERGQAQEVAAWRAASGVYAADRERGLAVFIPLVCPEAVSEPRVVEAYRARVEARCERVRTLLETHVYWGDEARELEREGRELTGSDEADASDYQTIVERHRRTQRWLERWERLRRASSPQAYGEAIFTFDEVDRMVAAAAAAVDQVMDRLEALDRSLREFGGAFPRYLLADLRQAAAEAEKLEERLAVLERAQAAVRGEAERLARSGEDGEGSPVPPSRPGVTATVLRLLFTWPGFAVASIAFIYATLELQWTLATVGKFTLILVLGLVLTDLVLSSAHRSQQEERRRSGLRLAAYRQALDDMRRFAAEARVSPRSADESESPGAEEAGDDRET